MNVATRSGNVGPGHGQTVTARPLLDVRGLRVDLPVSGQPQRVIHDVSLAILPGEAVGIVGESGSGKSMTARAIGRLLPEGAVVEGAVEFDASSILALKGVALRRYRTRDIAMIFQDPRAHINPVRTIGDFLTEVLVRELDVDKRVARSRAIETLDSVGISRGQQRLSQYPAELSGGMLQRVMIAAALLQEPRLLLADEPTTALDVTTQSEVMAILDELRRERGLALLFITHDLELAAAVCDRTAVMYAGSIVETQVSAHLAADPLHPYTAALLAARPSLGSQEERLAAIPGSPLAASDAPVGCPFAGRCPYVEPACVEEPQHIRDFGRGLVRCRRAEELRGKLLQRSERLTGG